MPPGRATPGAGRAAGSKARACSIRRSISRTAVEVLVDLATVARAELGVELPGVLEDEVEDAPLSRSRRAARPARRRAARRRRGGRRPARGRSPWPSAWSPTSRRCSTSRRSYSPSRSSRPGPRGRSPARATAAASRWPICMAATWSIETPARMLAPSVLSGCVPVRKQASERAWSPPSSPIGDAFCCARPLRTSRSSRNGSSGRSVGGRREPGPGLGGRPVGHVDAVGHVEERDPPGDRRACRRPWPRDATGRHRLEPGQGHGRAQPAQDRPPREPDRPLLHDVSSCPRPPLNTGA